MDSLSRVDSLAFSEAVLRLEPGGICAVQLNASSRVWANACEPTYLCPWIGRTLPWHAIHLCQDASVALGIPCLGLRYSRGGSRTTAVSSSSTHSLWAVLQGWTPTLVQASSLGSFAGVGSLALLVQPIASPVWAASPGRAASCISSSRRLGLIPWSSGLVLARVGGYHTNHPGVGGLTLIISRTLWAPLSCGQLRVDLPAIPFGLPFGVLAGSRRGGRSRVDRPARHLGFLLWLL